VGSLAYVGLRTAKLCVLPGFDTSRPQGFALRQARQRKSEFARDEVLVLVQRRFNQMLLAAEIRVALRGVDSWLFNGVAGVHILPLEIAHSDVINSAYN